MKNQALFSSKDKSKIKCHLLQFLFGALRVNIVDDNGSDHNNNGSLPKNFPMRLLLAI